MLRERVVWSLLLPNTVQSPLQHRLLSRLRNPRLQAPRISRASHRTFSSRALSRTSQAPVARAWLSSRFLRIRNIRHNSSQPTPSTAQESQSLTLSQRFKELSQKYGWAAVGVYLGLSALDFPFCFLAVRLVGTERIGEIEHAIAHSFWQLVGTVAPSMRPEAKAVVGAADGTEGSGVEVTEPERHEDASIWTQLLLAYGVHKSLIFFRIPLTAAVTPRVVKTLRGWGWNIGPRKAVSGTAK